MRKPIVAGNWKMNIPASDAENYLAEFLALWKETKGIDVVFFPMFTTLPVFAEKAKDTGLRWGAQNCHFESQGAWTGEVSIPAIEDLKASHVLLGHSERRQLFGESNDLIAKKMNACWSSSLLPVLCVGETKEQRQDGATEAILHEQLETAVGSLEVNSQASEMSRPRLILAYEPVWAIGTGEVATPDQAQAAHEYLRKQLETRWGSSTANSIPILYGGSVKPGNCLELYKKGDIDGFLVGGASLKPQDFAQICQTVLSDSVD